MASTRAHVDISRADSRPTASGCDCAVLAALAGLAAAWIAAGSVGLFAHPLQRAATLAALAVAALAQPTPTSQSKWRCATSVTIAILVVLLIASPMQVGNIAAAAVLLAFLAAQSNGRDQPVLLSASTAVVVLAIYRLAYTTMPAVWQVAENLSRVAGRLAATLSGRPLNVGPTFAGLDFLVSMLVLCGVWAMRTSPPRRGRVLYGLAAILGGHLCYLVALSFVPDLLATIPSPEEPAAWTWSGVAHKGLPWNMPILAGAIQLSIAAALFRWSPWEPSIPDTSSRIRGTLYAVAFFAAVLLPLVTSLYPIRPDLQDKKIVFHERGEFTW